MHPPRYLSFVSHCDSAKSIRGQFDSGSMTTFAQTIHARTLCKSSTNECDFSGTRVQIRTLRSEISRQD